MLLDAGSPSALIAGQYQDLDKSQDGPVGRYAQVALGSGRMAKDVGHELSGTATTDQLLFPVCSRKRKEALERASDLRLSGAILGLNL